MTLPEKRYYFLDEAADILQCKVRDLIHYGAYDELKISVEMKLDYKRKMSSSTSNFVGCGYHGFFQISAGDLRQLDMNREADSIEIHWFRPVIDDLIIMNQKFMKTLDPDDISGDFCFENAEPYIVQCSDLVIMRNDMPQFHKKCLKQKTEANRSEAPQALQCDSNKGGKPKGALAEAVEYIYLKLREQGNTEVLRAGKSNGFWVCMKEMASESKRNSDEYVLQRIKEVNIPKNGLNTVVTHDSEKRSAEQVIVKESRVYQKNAIGAYKIDCVNGQNRLKSQITGGTDGHDRRTARYFDERLQEARRSYW